MLTEGQKAAVEVFSDFLLDPNQQELVIEGHSGTGKTYLTSVLVDTANSLTGVLQLLTGEDKTLNMYFTATTNKAATVLKDTLKEDTSTIHSLLGLKVRQDFTNGISKLSKTSNYQVFKNTIIFIDEASMIDQRLLKMIQESTLNCKVIYIGDPYQLAPVFEVTAPVFSLPVTKVQLTEVKRNRGPIARLGEQFRKTVITDLFPTIIPNGNEIIQVDGPTFQSMVNTEFTRTEGNNKVLAWTNQRVNDYNKYIRGLFTSASHYEVGETVITNKPILIKGATAYSTEQAMTVTRVSKLTNEQGIDGYWYTMDYKVEVFQAANMNDVKEKLKHHKRNQEWVDFYQVTEFFADLRSLYASTVHKAQGSTHSKTFIDLEDISRCHKPNEVARMLYVATTRPTDQVILYGQLAEKYRG